MCILLLGFTIPLLEVSSALSLAGLLLLVASSFVWLFYVSSACLTVRRFEQHLESTTKKSLPQKLRALWTSAVELKPKPQRETWMEIERGAMEREESKARGLVALKILGVLAVVGLAYGMGNEHGYLKRDHELVTNIHFRVDAKVIESDGKGYHVFLTERGEEKMTFCGGKPVFAKGTILSQMEYEIRQAPENCSIMTGGVPLGYRLAALSRPPNKEQ